MQTEEIRAARRRSETERKMVRWKKKEDNGRGGGWGAKWVENSPIIEGDITKKVRKSTRGGERDRNCEKKL